MSVEFFNESRRMAVIKVTSSAELRISRSRADGSVVGFQAFGFSGKNPWKSLATQDLLDALSYVTSTDEQLLAIGMPVEKVKPQRKRNYKAEYAKRKAKRENKTDDELEDILRDIF